MFKAERGELSIDLPMGYVKVSPGGIRSEPGQTNPIRAAVDFREIHGTGFSSRSLQIHAGGKASSTDPRVKRIPAMIRWLLSARQDGGRTAVAIRAAAEDYRQRAMHFVEWMQLGVPILLLLLVALVVVPQFEAIYVDFDTELPMLTNAVLDITRVFNALFESIFVRIVFWAAVGMLVTYVGLRVALSCSWSLADPAKLRSISRAEGEASVATAALRLWPGRLLTTFPMLGPMLAWSQVASWPCWSMPACRCPRRWPFRPPACAVLTWPIFRSAWPPACGASRC